MVEDVGDDGSDGRELALGEVEDPVALVEQHQPEAEKTVGRAVGDAGDDRRQQVALGAERRGELVHQVSRRKVLPTVDQPPGWFWSGSVVVQLTFCTQAPVPPKCPPLCRKSIGT